MNRIFKNLFPFLIICFLGLVNINLRAQQKFLNTSHLDSLYEEINVNGNSFGIVHIYSEYPDYKWVGDDDEGIACVDDAARALIFYVRYSKEYNDTSSVLKAKKLVEFLVYMQSENGFFYNFILPDYSINRTHRNSIAEPNWWSWRALWALTEGYDFFQDKDSVLSNKIKNAVSKIVSAIKLSFEGKKQVVELNGFKRASWKPFASASDQVALIIVGLSKYYLLFGDNSILRLINDFSEGLLLSQEGSKNQFPYYAFLSWENSWHAWGNLQSYSLLYAYEVTKNQRYLKASLREIKNFYKYLIKENFLSGFSLKKDNGKIVCDSLKKFPQIAYGIRPIVFASMKAAELTGDGKYLSIAAESASWFFGNNPAKTKVYFEKSGICYDGIINQSEINKNSGAESTIEALLSLLSIEKNKKACELLNKIVMSFAK
ncbi:hypothetical protein ABRY23_13630 [Melioribacteraceae bacterium 4301-Me]|uniref:hypothetical protein n=1 Tax=Pyranulibacter aquaticus TaxID=3163344 RepID=UPI00359BFD5A